MWCFNSKNRKNIFLFDQVIQAWVYQIKRLLFPNMNGERAWHGFVHNKNVTWETCEGTLEDLVIFMARTKQVVIRWNLFLLASVGLIWIIQYLVVLRWLAFFSMMRTWGAGSPRMKAYRKRKLHDLRDIVGIFLLFILIT